MPSVTVPPTTIAALKEYFGQNETRFIDVFSKFMIGNQNERVIDISAHYGDLGYSCKGNLKGGLNTYKISYNLDTSTSRHAYYIDVPSLKLLLARIDKKDKYEEMEQFLDERALRPVHTPPNNAPTPEADIRSGETEREPQPAENETRIVPNRQRPTLLSFTGYTDHHSAQFYARETDGDFIDVYPIGRPDLMLSQEELQGFAIAKVGTQLDCTSRQHTHDTVFRNSTLLDSLETKACNYVERKVKEYLKNKNQLFEGTYRGKTTRDTELVLFKTQDEYNDFIKYVQKMVIATESSSELQMVIEQTKLEEAKAKGEVAKARIAEAGVKMARLEIAKIKLLQQNAQLPR